MPLWALLFGLAGCHPVGSDTDACEEGQFREGDACIPDACDLAAFQALDAKLVVSESGGTHTSLIDAIHAASPGDVIALDLGRWEAPGRIDTSLTIVGRCEGAVIVDDGNAPAISVESAEVTVLLRDLTVEGGAGLAVTAGRLELDDGVLTGGFGAGVHVSGAGSSAAVRRTRITDTVTDGGMAPGVWVDGGGAVELVDVTVTRTRAFGVLAEDGGSSLLATGLTVSDTFPGDEVDASGTVGVGIRRRATAVVSDVEISAQARASIEVSLASLELHDAFFHENRLDSNGQNGRGLSAVNGAEVVATDVSTFGVWEAAVYASQTSTIDLVGATLTRTRIASMFGDTDGYGCGVFVDGGATVRVANVTATESYGFGMAVADGELDVVDSVITGSKKAASTTSMGEGGFWVNWGATARVSGLRIEDGVQVGVLVGGATEIWRPGYVARLVMSDSEITGQTDESGYNGFGLELRAGSHVTLDRVNVHHNFGPGVLGTGKEDVEVTIRDSVIDSNRNAGIEGWSGVWAIDDTTVSNQTYDEQWGGAAGVYSDGAAMTLTDVDITDNEGIGLIGYDLGSVVTMIGGSVTGGRLYADPTAKDDLGYGVDADNNTVMRLEGVRIDGNRGVGVVAFSGSTLDIVDCDIGASKHNPWLNVAIGVLAMRGEVTVSGSRIHDNEGPGLAVFGSDVWVDTTEIDGNGYAGAAVSYGNLEIDACDVHDNITDASDGGGVGVFGSADDDAFLVVTDSTIHDHSYAAVWATGGSVRVSDSDLQGGTGVHVRDDKIMHGNAVFGYNTERWDGVSGLLIERSSLHDSAGPAVLLHRGSATLSDDTFAGNAYDVVQQDCDLGLLPPEGAPGAVICPESDQVVDTLFFSLFLADIAVESW